MSKVVWKYPLEITDRQELSVPVEAHFLHVGLQNGQVCAWALVDPSKEMETVPIHIVGTGNPMPPDDDWAYHLGTVQQGPFVWHVFVGGEVLAGMKARVVALPRGHNGKTYWVQVDQVFAVIDEALEQPTVGSGKR